MRHFNNAFFLFFFCLVGSSAPPGKRAPRLVQCPGWPAVKISLIIPPNEGLMLPRHRKGPWIIHGAWRTVWCAPGTFPCDGDDPNCIFNTLSLVPATPGAAFCRLPSFPRDLSWLSPGSTLVAAPCRPPQLTVLGLEMPRRHTPQLLNNSRAGVWLLLPSQ